MKSLNDYITEAKAITEDTLQAYLLSEMSDGNAAAHGARSVKLLPQVFAHVGDQDAYLHHRSSQLRFGDAEHLGPVNQFFRLADVDPCAISRVAVLQFINHVASRAPTSELATGLSAEPAEAHEAEKVPA